MRRKISWFVFANKSKGKELAESNKYTYVNKEIYICFWKMKEGGLPFKSKTWVNSDDFSITSTGIYIIYNDSLMNNLYAVEFVKEIMLLSDNIFAELDKEAIIKYINEKIKVKEPKHMRTWMEKIIMLEPKRRILRRWVLEHTDILTEKIYWEMWKSELRNVYQTCSNKYFRLGRIHFLDVAPILECVEYLSICKQMIRKAVVDDYTDYLKKAVLKDICNVKG